MITTSSDLDGHFIFPSPGTAGDYEIGAIARGFNEVTKTLRLRANESLNVDLQFTRLAERTDSVSVTADLKDIDVQSPDPAEKVFASEDLLDANPGRPGAPISIPGYPIETASSGIKAPQYFAPGVAGDHGEPIAQYVQVGSYLLPNNLSANAHGNGYADPNIVIANMIESVQVDGGAFNVREGGNHFAESRHHLLFAFPPRSVPHVNGRPTGRCEHGRLKSVYAFVDRHGGFSYGNGFLDLLEHRKQVKVNGGQVFRLGDHTLSLFGIGYYGFSYVAELSPILWLQFC